MDSSHKQAKQITSKFFLYERYLYLAIFCVYIKEWKVSKGEAGRHITLQRNMHTFVPQSYEF